MPQKSALIEPFVTLDNLPGAGFQAALKYWLLAKGDLELPPQSAIDPTRFPRGAVANFSVISVEEGPKRFRYRVMGSAIVQAWGEDPSGRFAEDLPNGREMADRMMTCVRRRQPYYSQGPLKFAVNSFMSFAVLVMPFAGRDASVSRLLVYNEFN